MKGFLNRLDAAMHHKRLNKSKLARELGTKPSTVGRWFAGSMPKEEAILDLCRILDVTREWLLHGESVENDASVNVLREEEPTLPPIRQRFGPEYFAIEAERITLEKELYEQLRICTDNLEKKSDKEIRFYISTAKRLLDDYQKDITTLKNKAKTGKS